MKKNKVCIWAEGPRWCCVRHKCPSICLLLVTCEHVCVCVCECVGGLSEHVWTGAVTSYTAERGELDGGRELLTKKKSASSGLKDTRWRIRKHNCPTKKRKAIKKRREWDAGQQRSQWRPHALDSFHERTRHVLEMTRSLGETPDSIRRTEMQL